MEQIGREVAVALRDIGATAVDIKPLPDGGVRVQPVDDSYLTPEEVASILNIRPVTVCRWAERGRLSHVRGPGKKGFYRFELGQLRKDLTRLQIGRRI